MEVDAVPAMQPGRKWYALRVKTRYEQRVALVSQQKGCERFVPVYYDRRRWSDRMKLVALPLFPGYVFCRLDITDQLPLLTIPSVLHFAGVRNAPVPIHESEIAAIRIASQSGFVQSLGPAWSDVSR